MNGDFPVHGIMPEKGAFLSSKVLFFKKQKAAPTGVTVSAA